MFYGVAYYPEHWPESNWQTDAHNIRQAGMEGVRIGEFAWSKMEPADGQFEFAWLDRAVETLSQAGLKIILCTPTATPPLWLIEQHPDILPWSGDGVQMKAAVRKYYCHSHMGYRQYCQRITDALAQRYGQHPSVVGWQIDNELGDHDTVRCYCPHCRVAFSQWCQRKFSTLAALNEAWGTVFWNQIYSTWAQIDLPYPRREIGLNPGHLLDYYRFASDQVIDFAKVQIDALRAAIAPNQWITTNIIPTYWEINFKALAQHLDFLSWDCYTVIDANSPVRQPPVGPSPPVVVPPRPPMIAFVQDMMRSCSRDPFWVMETAGQDRLVLFHTLAHGGGGVSTFTWKSPRFGAEQSRGGYEQHGIFSARFYESQKIAADLNTVASTVAPTRYAAQVGLFYDIEMGWAYDIHHVYPRSRWLDGVGYWRLMEEFYTAFWGANIPVAPVGIPDDLNAYAVVVVPCLYLTTPEINQKLVDYVEQGGTLIVGPASGAKNWHNAYSETLPPIGQLQALFGCALIGSGSLGYFNVETTVTLSADAPFTPLQTYPCRMRSSDHIGFFSSTRPAEILRPTTAHAFGHYPQGQTACTIQPYGAGQAIYLGFSPDDGFWRALIDWLTTSNKVTPLLAPVAGVEVTQRSGTDHDLLFVLNHLFVPTTISLPATYRDLITQRHLEGEVLLAPQTTLILEQQSSIKGGT
jgi:beta-galactosidase